MARRRLVSGRNGTMIVDCRGRVSCDMEPHNDTASELPAAVPRRSGADWGHLPHGHLTDLIIGAGFEVHNMLGAGFLEAVYANALTVELRHRGVFVERNVAFEVVYRGVSVGRYVADLVVDRGDRRNQGGSKAIDPVHRAQVSNYLRASGLEVGLVLNFGSSVQCKRVMASSGRDRAATGHNDGRKAEDLTRMNYDHDDDADLFREHPTITAPQPVILLSLTSATERLPGESERQCRRGQSASSS